MENDPLIFEEYITSVKYSMTPEERSEIDETVLRDFVQIINTQYDKPFPIALTWVARWLGYKNEHHLRDLLFQRNRIEKNVDFRSNVHYTVQPYKTSKNQMSSIIWISLSCFKELCQRVSLPRAKTIRKYFEKVEEIHRESVQKIISSRRGSYRTIQEIEDAYSLDDHAMPRDADITYLDEILQHGKKFYKVGHTKQGRIRLIQLRMDYPGLHRYRKIIYIHENIALEEIIKALSEKWMIKCSTPPCPKEIFFTRDYPVDDVMFAALGGLNYAKKLLEEKTHQNHQSYLPSNASNTLSSEETPFHFTRRKNGKRHEYVIQNGEHLNVP